MKSKDLAVELHDQIVSRYRSERGYNTISKALNTSIVKWEMFGTKMSGQTQ